MHVHDGGLEGKMKELESWVTSEAAQRRTLMIVCMHESGLQTIDK